MSIYADIPPKGGSPYWSDAVDTAADLPGSAITGDAILAIDSGVIYYFDGAAWAPTAGTGVGVMDTDSVDLTLSGGNVSADLKLSSNAATAGSTLVSLNVESAGVHGLRAQFTNAAVRSLLSGTAPVSYSNTTGVISMHVADSTHDGYLSSADWVIFNNKQGLAGITSGASAASGNIGEVLTATTAANTTTGVGATGVYGSSVSLTLTAGDWLVDGVAGLSQNAAVLTAGLQVGISTDASGATINEFYTQLQPYLLSSTSDALISAPPQEFNVSISTAVYLNTLFNYTSGTPKHRGMLRARRIR